MSNNDLGIRGRFVRDPVTVDAKDNSGRKFVFGRVACDEPYKDASGDLQSRTTYFDLKVFDDGNAQVLIAGDARKGTMIRAKGAARPETSDYERDGEQRTSFSIACVVDSEGHTVEIEKHAKEPSAA